MSVSIRFVTQVDNKAVVSTNSIYICLLRTTIMYMFMAFLVRNVPGS